MSSSATGGDALGRVGGEASPSVLPSMEDVLPILGVDGSTGEAIPIDVAPSLREADDPFRVDVVRWAALDVPSIMVEEDLMKLKEAYRIPADIELILPGPNVFFEEGMHNTAFKCVPNEYSQMARGMYLWFRHSFGMEMSLRVFQTIYQPRKLPKKKGGSRMILLLSLGRVFEDSEPDLDVPSVYRIANSLPRCELSRDIVDVLRSIYQADPKTRSYGLILNRQRCLVELGLMASKAEMDQGKRPRPMLARLTKQRPKVLVPGSAEDTSQRKVIEDLTMERNREAVGASTVIEVDDASEEEVPLSRKRKARASEIETSQARRNTVEVVDNYTAPGGGDGRPYDSKRWFRELIGAPGARIPDDALRNLPFYPSMGAQTVKKYFTPKWEEFSSHEELEDVLEASLASAIRASAMQLKVLGEFRTRMQEQRKLIAEASKSDNEHK
ncbi:putative abhydrolase domain-containing protein [Abeliophyllum distichum]|uniref:Abhydrolase domain-containing protein n=1 Tax=Abeliophyllum distichum TaxID=126358 RepID=A0ABD1TWB1_9LAMI